MLWTWKGASEQIVNAWVVGDHTNPGNVHLFLVNLFYLFLFYSCDSLKSLTAAIKKIKMIEIIYDGNKISGYPDAILATILVIVLPSQKEICLEIIFWNWHISISFQN